MSEVTELKVKRSYKPRTRLTVSPLGLESIKPVKKKSTSGIYSNADGEKKAEARKFIIDAVKLNPFNQQRILSLPADNYTLETLLFKHIDKNIKFDVCERDTKTYNRLLEKLKYLPKSKKPTTIYRGDIGDVINEAKENKYTHIVLDYCGQVGTFANEIRTAVNNNIVQVNGTISMTFCKRASGKLNLQFMKKMLRLNGKIKGLTQINNCETDIEKAIYKFLSIICKENYAIEKQFAYKDKDKSSMVLFIIRRLS